MSKVAQTETPNRNRKKFTKSKGTLAAIGGLMILSATLRVGVGAGEAFAKQDGEFTSSSALQQGKAVLEPDVAAQNRPEMQGEAPAAPYASYPLTAEQAMPLIEELNARDEMVSKREVALQIRMNALAVAERAIDHKLAQLEKAEKALSETIQKASTAAQDDVDRLTEVYANMKPKRAAALFEEMAPDFAAGFIAQMRSDSAAAIMAGLSPEAAYLISVVLAGRNADVPLD